VFVGHSIYMGPWDIMSQHFVKVGEPPPGLSSFTKIRLGWIGKDQVQIVKAGDTSLFMLSPLSKGGNLLAVKIPLDDGSYYLVENRQPIGFDKMLPDSGILILEVHPDAREGYGTVKVKSAGGSPDFADATYKVEMNNRNIFIDNSSSGLFKRRNIAIIPLWNDKGGLGVLITTPDQGEAAVKAARAIKALTEQGPSASDNEREAKILEAITAFKSKNFENSYAIATRSDTAR
jgi:hypothetical protein